MRLRGYLLLAGLSFLHGHAVAGESIPTNISSPSLKAAAPAAPALIMDRPFDVLYAVRVQANDALVSADFDFLDQTEKELMTANSRAPDGTCKLPMFLEGLSKPPRTDNASWQKLFAQLGAWQRARPQSITPAAALAMAWTNYAWAERGKLMMDRVARARKILDDAYAAHHGKDISPSFYESIQYVAFAQGWSLPEYDKMFNEAVAAYPDCEFLYFNKAYYLAPRFYGSPGDAEKFAEESAQKRGPVIYARILWSASALYGFDNLFNSDFGARWDLTKSGFEEMEKQCPTSLWNLNAFCRFAVAAKDKATARTLFDKIGTNFYANIWGLEDAYNAGKGWANGP